MKFGKRIKQLSCISALMFALGAGSAIAQVPGAPLIGTAAAGNAQAFVFFTAPASTGGSAITAFTASCNPGAITGSSATAPIPVSGLANATAYNCSVTAANASGSSAASTTVSVTPSASAPLTLLGVKSRKTHSTSGVFDIAIDNTIPITGPVSVEPRIIDAGHRVVFQFNATVSSFGPVTTVDDAAATITATPTQSANEVIVTLPAVPDKKRVTVSLPTVNGIAVNASASLAFRIGDVDASGTVTYDDVSTVKSRSGQMTVAANFRSDVSVSGAINSADISAVKSRATGAPPAVGPEPGTIMFVTQVPTLNDFASRATTFGNHTTSRMENVVRGGDLMIRYPDGVLRSLTREAGFGGNIKAGGIEEQRENAIAVREPTIHWSGNKAIFSMVVGAPKTRYEVNDYYWQIYEVTGLLRGQTAVITKVANQPLYNNVSPFYGTDDRILFTSDRPRNGQAHLYPQLDEYESAETVSGIWSLDPASADLRLLTHTPSGAFSPSIDSFGRVVFIRWDHMQQDQQADVDRADPVGRPRGSFNFSSEAVNATPLSGDNVRAELFPEPRAASLASGAAYGTVNGYTANFFTPWQINEDGTDEETLNHIGRQEFAVNQFLQPSFASDNQLTYQARGAISVSDGGIAIANTKSIRDDGGMFHLREDPTHPGTYFGIAAREFGTLTSDQIIKVTGAPGVNPEAMVLSDVTAIPPPLSVAVPGGRFRNPLPMKSGALIASHTERTVYIPEIEKTYPTDFRLRNLVASGNLFVAGTPLTSGINKSVTWFSPDEPLSYNGPLWEIEPVEVVARARPNKPASLLDAPESAVFAEESVNELTFRNWLKTNNLALIVTRNQTTRDRGDLQQPFNLQVPGGVKTIAAGARGAGKLYDISHFQIVQGDLIRGYAPDGQLREGRRVIAQPMHDDGGKNIANPGGPAGSVKIAADGSTAAFVPARRALAWQSTDAAGNPVVRERVWVTMQPGEVRVCASCHGANVKDQAGNGPPTNKPEALRTLLQAWKLLPP